jgi:hypothetical protein
MMNTAIIFDDFAGCVANAEGQGGGRLPIEKLCLTSPP